MCYSMCIDEILKKYSYKVIIVKRPKWKYDFDTSLRVEKH